MRDFKGMKRQRNRGRGGGGGGNGGGKPQHNANRAFDSNGPDNVKVRGAAQHIYEKYQQLARDAGSAGDRVLAENYLQHAEHYFRVLRAMQPLRPISEIIGRDQFASGYDIDFEDESGQNGEDSGEQGETEAAQDGRRDQWQRDEQRPAGNEFRQRDDRPQGEFRPRDDRPQGEFRQRDDRNQGDYRPREERQPRDERPQGEFRPREDRYQNDRQGQGERQGQGQGQQPRYPREDRQGRFQGERQDRPQRDFRADRPERDPLNVIEPQATPLTTPAPAPAYEPRETAPASVLRGEDGTTSHAPAFLQPRAEPRPESEDEPVEARRPRRRRAPRSFEAGEAPAPVEADEG
jgi:hypothetical protein